MLKTILKLFTIAAIATAVTPPSSRAESSSEEPAIRAAEVRGGGGWKTHGKAQQPAQRWNLDLHRTSPTTLEGTVTLSGSPLAAIGTAKIQIEGSKIHGTITGEGDELVAKVAGQITREGFKGTYTDRTGEVGDWEWEGRLPE